MSEKISFSWKLFFSIFIIFSLLELPLLGEEDMNNEISENIIWEIIHEDDEKNYIKINSEYISTLSTEIKSIIAFYSTFIPEYFLKYNNTEKILANALGNFSTLEEAQSILLYNTIIDYRMPNEDFPHTLIMKIKNDRIIFEGFLYKNKSRKIINEYILGNDGIIRNL